VNIKFKSHCFLRRCICVVLIFITTKFDRVNAEILDKTQLIDTTNEATIRGSCAAIGHKIKLATNQIQISLLNEAATNQDRHWKQARAAEDIRNFGERAEFAANSIRESASKNIQPSKLPEFLTAFPSASIRFDRVLRDDPFIAIEAWENCSKLIFGFQSKVDWKKVKNQIELNKKNNTLNNSSFPINETNCRPIYPRQSIREGEQGIVITKVLVGDQGVVKQVELESSSGYPRLDGAALDAAKSCRPEQPKDSNGNIIEGWVSVPFTFKLSK
jgi:TonB family protein